MITLQMLGDEKVKTIELPDPVPHENLVVVKIEASAICSSEMKAYRSDKEGDDNEGHEPTGIVWKTSGAKRVSEGDRVMLYAGSHCGRCIFCRRGDWHLCISPSPIRSPGAHSQYVLLDENLCLPLPDDVSFESGTLLGDAIGTPYRAAKRIGVSCENHVLVVGQGPVGLGATFVCKLLGARVLALEISRYRSKLALKMGADVILDPHSDDVQREILERTNGVGMDIAIECSGTSEGELIALEAVKRSGKVAFIGENDQDLIVRVSDHFIRKELVAIGSWYFNAADYEDIVSILQNHRQIEELITHEFPISEAQTAFDIFTSGSSGKVLIKPWA